MQKCGFYLLPPDKRDKDSLGKGKWKEEKRGRGVFEALRFWVRLGEGDKTPKVSNLRKTWASQGFTAKQGGEAQGNITTVLRLA